MGCFINERRLILKNFGGFAKSVLLFVLVSLCGCFATAPVADGLGQVQVSDLRCEYLKNPLGIDTPKPRFSWKITDS